jgi:enolase
MSKITKVLAREIFDAKGNPTIETTVITDDNHVAVSSVPSGTSVGRYEAYALLDHDSRRYLGLGVLKAIENIEKVIAPQLIGRDPTKQQEIDNLMIQLDATPNKAKLGANAMLSVSIAVVKAGALASNQPLYVYISHLVQGNSVQVKLPITMFNLINGGLHAGSNVDMQEFLVIPATFKKLHESLHIGFLVYKNLKDLLKHSNLITLIGDEGGYGPTLPTNEDALSLLSQAIEVSTMRLGYDVFCGIDAASSNFYKDGQYKIKDKTVPLNAQELITYYQNLIGKYHMLYIEDALAEDDWEGWTLAFAKLGQDVILTGDDLTATNPFRLQEAIQKKAISGIIIKPNQIGTVIESLAVVEMARLAGLKITVSHRSGETNDDFIADFAVGVAADYVKFGAPARGERVAKYNRLLAIEKELMVG